MKLFIVRHGEAESQAPSDAERQLTARGVAALEGLWEGLAGQVKPTMLLVSPYVRAQQTADVIARYYPGVKRQTLDCITPDDDPRRVLAWLGQQADPDGWMLVSHMPLVALLTGLLTEADGSRVPFATGTVACLEMEVMAAGGGRLIWQEHAT